MSKEIGMEEPGVVRGLNTAGMVKDETEDIVRGQIMKDLQYPKVAPDR